MTPTPQPPKKLKAKKQEALAAAASQAEFDRLRRRGALLSSAVRTARSGPSLTVLVSYFYVISTAAARVGRRGRGWPRRTTSSTDGRRREGAEERLLARLGMSEYYGSEGFDRPPSDVYSYGGGYFGDDGAGA